MKFDVTTADTSIGAAQFYQFFQKIEGQNVAQLMWGTSNAESVTLSFWCRSNKTGTYITTFMNNAADRFNPNNFTISSANTWEKKTITISGDTTGTWLTTNGIGLYVIWNLALGSNFDDGTDGTWGSGDYGSGGNVNFLDSTSNEFYITGVQLEIGDVATPFEHEDFGTTFFKCQRYFQNNSGKRVIRGGYVSSGGTSYYTVKYTTAMRATPTVTFVSVSGSGFSNANPNTQQIGTESFEVYKSATGTSGSGYYLFTYTVDAEL